MAPGSHLVLAASEDCSSTHCVSQVGAKSLGVYAVNYPASNDFASSDFLRRSSTEFATRALISSQWR